MCEGGCYAKGSGFSSSGNLKNMVLDNNNFKNSNRIAHLYSVFNSVGHCIMKFNIFCSHKFLNAQCFLHSTSISNIILKRFSELVFLFSLFDFFFDCSEIFYGSK